MRKLKAGLRKNTKFMNIKSSLQEMELMLAVLRHVISSNCTSTYTDIVYYVVFVIVY